jgi:hypothetical protein
MNLKRILYDYSEDKIIDVIIKPKRLLKEGYGYEITVGILSVF